MVVSGLKSDRTVLTEPTTDRIRTAVSNSDEKLITVLQPTLLTYLITKEIIEQDRIRIDSTFHDTHRLMIISDNKCIYPSIDNSGECSICIIIKENQINVCDLQSNHPQLVTEIEDSWPSMLDTASKIKQTFEMSAGSLLVNRSSGRIIAASNSLKALTGFSSDEIIGKEYSQVAQRIQKLTLNKTLTIDNFSTSEISLSLVSINDTSAKSSEVRPNNTSVNTHVLTDESKTIDLHFSRLNALINNNLFAAMSPKTVESIEQVIKELKHLSPEQDSANYKAGLRLLLQSVLMAHLSVSRDECEPTTRLQSGKNNRSFLLVESRVSRKPEDMSEAEQWLKTARELSEKLGIEVSELTFSKNTLKNKLKLNTEQ